MRFNSIDLTLGDVRGGIYKLLEPRPDDADNGADNDVDIDVAKNGGDFDVEGFTVREEALVGKLDRRIMPCLFGMIVLNYLDRNSLANARIQGIEQALGLSGSDFSTAISVFFVGYIGLQIPSNLLITRVRPSIYLPGCMIAWGFLSGASAFVTSFKGLVMVRFLLGFVEAPFFPGALFLLSSWYTRKELALRTAILYAGSLLAGAFGGLVGASIEYFFNGFMGVESWRWLFMIEASCTILLAISAMFILPDYPHSTRFLTPDERAIAMRRVQDQSGVKDSTKGSLMTGLKMALTDYKVWLLSLIIITKTSAGAVTSFIPTLVGTFGLGRVNTLLLVAPPYVCAAAMTLVISRMSDRLGDRAYHIMGPMVLAALGFFFAAVTLNTAVRYLSLFLMLGGVYGSYNVALAWISSTLPRPVEKRSAAIAIINTMGNVAQIYSPYFYLPENGPRYLLAMVANVCFCAACIGVTVVLRKCLKQENEDLTRRKYDDGYDINEVDEIAYRYTL
ncbi:MFS transporter [Microthyrium microscopicum]|uniref:MFS transporter n=1 Tax=Microthyrium microscopicum TaxID=703497 RepID=A0A6A6UBH9_9PEZI|nr:MFS transporter [Microthyrium microscopicum]